MWNLLASTIKEVFQSGSGKQAENKPMPNAVPAKAIRKIPCAVIEVRPDGIFLSVFSGSSKPAIRASRAHLMVLEILVHDPDVNRARIEFNQFAACDNAFMLNAVIPDIQKHERCVFSVQFGAIECISRQSGPAGDLSAASRQSRQVLRAVAEWFEPEATQFDDFDVVFDFLEREGFVAPPVGELNWGDLRRMVPVCSRFGFSRGSPIDRYYLDQFIEKIRPLVHGDVVEIGGKDENGRLYQFEHAVRYRGFDMFEDPDISLVGDAHDPNALAEAQLDTIIAFNVLEHCPKPWIVIDNMRRWLKPDGLALVMVPSCQRLHRMPEDYWRPLPAALIHLFTTWADCELHVYGNPSTAIAAMLGIAVEELSVGELDAYHPDYPVTTCVIAKKSDGRRAELGESPAAMS